MKTMFHMDINALNPDGSHSHVAGYVRKELEIDFFIAPGTLIEDSPLGEGKVVTSSTFSLLDGSVYVTLEDEGITTDKIGTLEQIYTDNGWEAALVL